MIRIQQNTTKPRNMKKKSFPLHKVVEYKNIHKIKILLPECKDLNEKNDKGKTVLLIACELDNEEILDLLLKRSRDVDINITNDDGFNALHILAFRGNLKGIIKIMNAFPEVDIEAVTDNGNTPLIMASKLNHVDVIKYLARKGANINHANNKKFTALQYAANEGYPETVKVLIELGADVNHVDDYNLTPLIKTCKWGFLDTCKILLENGANVNFVSCNGQSALRASCFKNNVKLTKVLILSGANVNHPGPYSTALFECAKFGNLECAKELIRAGVKVTGKTPVGKSAMDLAKQHGQREFVELIKVYF